MKIKNVFYLLTLLFSFFVSSGESVLKASAGGLSDDEICWKEFLHVSQEGLSDQNPQIELEKSFNNFVEVSAKFIEDLHYHKSNAILIRDNVQRANNKFSLADRERVFNIDFKNLKFFIEENSSASGEQEENICTLIRVIQVISEDQLTFYARYLETMSKLKSIAATEPTCRLVEGQYLFADSYNNLLKDVFQFFLGRFPTAPVFKEIEIELVINDLARIPKLLGSLSQKYNIKLSLLKVPLRLEGINKIHSTDKVPSVKRQARRGSEPFLRRIDNHPKDIIDRGGRNSRSVTEIGGLYSYQQNMKEGKSKSSSKKKKSPKASKDKRKKTIKKDKKKSNRGSFEMLRERLSPRKVKFDRQNDSSSSITTSNADNKKTRNT